MTRPEELLDKVVDQQSFVAFVWALADEREQAENMEREQPVLYSLSGALNWQNGDIPSFLGAALNLLEKKDDSEPDEQPSWKLFADFLYHGKIIE